MLARVLDLVADLPQHQRLGNVEAVPGEDRVEDRVLERAPVLRLAPRLQPLADLLPQRVEGLEVPAHALGELVVQRGQHLLLDLGDGHRRLRRLAAQRLVAVVVREADANLARAARAQAHHRLVDLGQDPAPADHESVAGLRAGLHALRGQGVVDDHQVPGIGRPLHRPILGVLLLQGGEGLVHLALLERLRGVLDREPGIGPQGDRRLHLDHRRELERGVLLEGDLLEVGLLHRLDVGLGQGLPVDVGDQPPGHLLPDVVGEVELDHAPGHLALSEAGQLGLALHAPEGLLPGSGHHLRRLLHLQAALAGPQLLDVDFHGCFTLTIGPHMWKSCCWKSRGLRARDASYTIRPHRQQNNHLPDTAPGAPGIRRTGRR